MPLEWNNGQPVPIAIQHFDFEALDSPEDIAKELLSAGHSLAEALEERAIALLKFGTAAQLTRLMPRLQAQFRDAIVADTLSYLASSDNAKLDVQLLSVAIDLSHMQGAKVPDVCRAFGIRKQAGYQRLERLLAAHGLTHLRTDRRSPEARARMRRRNYRHRESGREPKVERREPEPSTIDPRPSTAA